VCAVTTVARKFVDSVNRAVYGREHDFPSFCTGKRRKVLGGGDVPPPPFFIGALGIGGALEEIYDDL
jgi:hypothetical protein